MPPSSGHRSILAAIVASFATIIASRIGSVQSAVATASAVAASDAITVAWRGDGRGRPEAGSIRCPTTPPDTFVACAASPLVLIAVSCSVSVSGCRPSVAGAISMRQPGSPGGASPMAMSPLTSTSA
jgi:hypothetical protein